MANNILKKILPAFLAKNQGAINSMPSLLGQQENNVTAQQTGTPIIKDDAHSPRNYMVPYQLPRIRADFETLDFAISEAENAYYPHRVSLQQVYQTIQREGHTKSCINKRKNLTLLKTFKVGKKTADGQFIENKQASAWFKKRWFKEILGYVIDAQFTGYNLIQLGNLVSKNKDYNFKGSTLLKPWHVSPDRKNFVRIPYQIWGVNIDSMQARMVKYHDDKNAISFSDADTNGVAFDDWMLYVDTPTDTGASICGYGLLFYVAIYSIVLKDNLSDNADYNQNFVAPYRHLKTHHEYGSPEYIALEKSLAYMGNKGYLLSGLQEELDFLNGNTGTGFQSYGDFEKRQKDVITTLFFGHADAMNSTPGKLGGAQGDDSEDKSPVDKAIEETEKTQDEFVLSFLNDVVAPKFRNLGIPIPEDEEFYLPNDKEQAKVRKEADKNNLATAMVWKTAKEAGLKLDAKKFEEITGIPTEEVEEPALGGNADKIKKLQAKLKQIYRA